MTWTSRKTLRLRKLAPFLAARMISLAGDAFMGVDYVEGATPLQLPFCVQLARRRNYKSVMFHRMIYISGLGERGPLARRFRRLAENTYDPNSMLLVGPNWKGTGRRDASQSDRDDRAPQTDGLAIVDLSSPA